jgi:hypothetical protein
LIIVFVDDEVYIGFVHKNLLNKAHARLATNRLFAYIFSTAFIVVIFSVKVMKKKSFSSVKNVACLLVCVLWFVIVLC